MKLVIYDQFQLKMQLLIKKIFIHKIGEKINVIKINLASLCFN